VFTALFADPVVCRVIIGLFGTLLVSSIIGRALSRRPLSDGSRATVTNLVQRVNSWWVMCGLILIALAVSRVTSVGLFALLSFLALREYLTVTPTRLADHRTLSVMFFVVLPYQYWLVYKNWYGMFAVMIPVYAFILLPALTVLHGETRDFLERSARNQWGLLVCVYSISHIPMLLNLDIATMPHGNAGLVLFLVIVTQGSDVLQYVWGKLAGRRPVAPKLSPKKTVEGFIGGVLSASALGALLHRLTPFGPGRAFVIALVLTLMGFLGGLIMSAIKRDRGIKDWGSLIEGHGGILDRMDSLCFSAPIFFHIIRFFHSGS
jgi:phosphatidate cytidylyltransferase